MKRETYTSFGTQGFDRYSSNLLPVLPVLPGEPAVQTSSGTSFVLRQQFFTAFHFGDKVTGDDANTCMRRRLNAILRPFAADHQLLELIHFKQYAKSNKIAPSHLFYVRLGSGDGAHLINTG